MGIGPRVERVGNRFEDSLRDGAITDHWDVRGEAKSFLRLILRGHMTIEHAKIDICMTERQFVILIHKNPIDAALLQRIKWKREETWRVLLGMYRQATGRAVAA